METQNGKTKIIPLSVDRMAQIYRERMTADFPDSERKPFSVIRSGMERGTYAGYGLFEGTELLGYAFFVITGDHLLLDYLAIDGSHRGLGHGSFFVKNLRRLLSGAATILLEAEDPDAAEAPAERQLRQKRLAFYEGCGCTDTGVRARTFGVDFRILSMGTAGRPLSEKEVCAVYRSHFRATLPWYLYLTKIRLYRPKQQKNSR